LLCLGTIDKGKGVKMIEDCDEKQGRGKKGGGTGGRQNL